MWENLTLCHIVLSGSGIMSVAGLNRFAGMGADKDKATVPDVVGTVAWNIGCCPFFDGWG